MKKSKRLMEEFFNEIGDMRFDNIMDLYARRKEIKEKYLMLDLGFKEIYKWYFFFELCILSNDLKSAMWTYLNCEVENTEINLDLHIEYCKYLKKREKLLDNIQKEQI